MLQLASPLDLYTTWERICKTIFMLTTWSQHFIFWQVLVTVGRSIHLSVRQPEFMPIELLPLLLCKFLCIWYVQLCHPVNAFPFLILVIFKMKSNILFSLGNRWRSWNIFGWRCKRNNRYRFWSALWFSWIDSGEWCMLVLLSLEWLT